MEKILMVLAVMSLMASCAITDSSVIDWEQRARKFEHYSPPNPVKPLCPGTYDYASGRMIQRPAYDGACSRY